MTVLSFTEKFSARPFLKWAGGKTQLLPTLSRHVPAHYSKYIEPFLGGGALFFHLQPEEAILSDFNPDLINCYQVVKNQVEALIAELQGYRHDEQFFYQLREQATDNEGDPIRSAARFVYLNRTCFNGLYRVNKKGEFNVPFGSYKNPKICDPELLRAASRALQGATLLTGDYREILREYAGPRDFVYLDPPYFPTSPYSDFKRYTKPFYEEDHVTLAREFRRAYEVGAWAVLTNSNTEFTRRLYQDFPYEVVNTKRNINSKGTGREGGEDLIVLATRPPAKTRRSPIQKSETLSILERFPTTRFMGSKYNVLDFLWETLEPRSFTTALDAFSGSGCVSYLLKLKGKNVFSNDLMTFCYHTANGIVANPGETIRDGELQRLLEPNANTPDFIQRTFGGLYFSDGDNAFLDRVRFNIEQIAEPHKKSLALSALVRACLKRRPRGIFTYVGDRYDDQRADLRMDLREHFIRAVKECNEAVLPHGATARAYNQNVFDLDVKADLVYIDPPYYSPLSDSDYVRRYHFVEGLVKYWQGVEIDYGTKTRKFKKYPTEFDGQAATYAAFPKLFEKFKDSILVVSYSSNSLPNKSEMVEMLKTYKKKVSVHQVCHQYSFGNQNNNDINANEVSEYVFVAE